MSTSATTPPRDQASRLRSMVSSLDSPSVTVVHWSERAAANNQRTITVNLPAKGPAPRREVKIPVVAITSGKGGVGKTSLAVNLAVALARRECRTSLLDADLGLANADLLCGLNPTTRLDVAADPGRPARRSLDQIAVKAPGGFRLVPGSVGVTRMANLTAPQRDLILDGLADLERESDIILIDTGAGLAEGVTSFLLESDLTVVVATPEPTSIADAYALIKCVVQTGRPPVFALAMNQVADEQEALDVHARIANTCKRFLGLTLPLIGIIRRDAAVSEAVRAREPFLLGTPRARASRDVTDMACRMMRTLDVGPAAHRTVRRGLFGIFGGR